MKRYGEDFTLKQDLMDIICNRNDEMIKMKKYLVCELNDKSYTEASFYFFYTKNVARSAATMDSIKYFDGNCEIQTTDYGNRICSRNNDYYGESFYVTEIKEIDEENGTHLLIWHHAYEGVGFEIRFQGTYEECVSEREREMAEVRDNLEYPDEEMFDNVIDTGNEWEVWDIVEIGE